MKLRRFFSFFSRLVRHRPTSPRLPAEHESWQRRKPSQTRTRVFWMGSQMQPVAIVFEEPVPWTAKNRDNTW